MIVEILHKEEERKLKYDSEIFTSIVWTTNRGISVSTVSLTMTELENGTSFVKEGDIVVLYDPATEDRALFKGMVVSVERGSDGLVTALCKDQLMYLKARRNIFINDEMNTFGDVLNFMAKQFGIKLGEVENPDVPLRKRVIENTECLTVLDELNQYVTWQTKTIHQLRDVAGVVEYKSLLSRVRRELFSEKTIIYDYSYSSSIEDLYNEVMVVRKESSVGGVYVARINKLIKKYGRLLYHEVADGSMTPDQITEVLIRNILHKSVVAKKLSLNCVGIPWIVAGDIVPVFLPKIDSALQYYMIVDAVEHAINEEGHVMTVELAMLPFLKDIIAENISGVSASEYEQRVKVMLEEYENEAVEPTVDDVSTSVSEILDYDEYIRRLEESK